MTSTWNILNLEIIGYADSRDETLLPAIVPPVFRSITNSRIILVPPYKLETEAVIGATRISMDEAKQLEAEGSLTHRLADPRGPTWLSVLDQPRWQFDLSANPRSERDTGSFE